jgi:hypothetical protein
MFDAAKRTRYMNLIWHADLQPPSDKGDKQIFNNQKHDARHNYKINEHNQLIRLPQRQGENDRIVVCEYDAFGHVARIHKRGGHNGYRKRFDAVHEELYGLKRNDVKWLINHCQLCQVNRSNSTRAPLNPIIATEVYERVQADLIDMRHQPDGHNKWILHIKDHYSKYSTLYALTNKTASEVARNFEMYIRHYGTPEIFQCDNGKEFKGALLIILKRTGIKLINGRPRHPQTQGLVEQANGIVKTKLTKWQAERGTSQWASALTEICMAMNLQVHTSLPAKTTPFKVFFSRPPKVATNHIVDRATEEEETYLENITTEDIDEVCATNDQIDNFLATAFGFVPTTDKLERVDRDQNPNGDLPNITTHMHENAQSNAPEDDEHDSINGSFRSAAENIEDEENDLSNIDPRLLEMNREREETTTTRSISDDGYNYDGDIQELTSRVQNHQAGVRKSMAARYNKKFKPAKFSVGELATIRIPRTDRASTDNKRAFVIVKAIKHEPPVHQLQSLFGVLDHWYPTGELNKVPQVDEDTRHSAFETAPSKIVTLHYLATQVGNSNRQDLLCSCRGKCGARCRCVKNGKNCTQYCHSASLACGNEGSQEEVTRIAVVDRIRDSTELQSEFPGLHPLI